MEPILRTTHAASILGLALAALASPAALAQETSGETETTIRPELPELPQVESDAQTELRELFVRVERNLIRMEQYLLDASAGETSKLKEVGESGIDDLLENAPPGAASGEAGGVMQRIHATRARGERVLEDIDRILEIASQSGGSCSGGSCEKPGSQSSDKPSPADQPSGTTERMQGNRAPGEKPEQQQQQSEQQNGDPRGNRDSKEPPSSSAAKEVPEQATETPPPVGADADRWGELPIYARDLFRAEGGRELPPQYRDWIDAYYRRLNKRSEGN